MRSIHSTNSAASLTAVFMVIFNVPTFSSKVLPKLVYLRFSSSVRILSIMAPEKLFWAKIMIFQQFYFLWQFSNLAAFLTVAHTANECYFI